MDEIDPTSPFKQYTYIFIAMLAQQKLCHIKKNA